MLKKLIVALMSITVLFSISSPAIAAVNENKLNENTNCSDCLTEAPDSTGSKENIKKTENMVYASDAFKNETKTMSGTFDKSQAIINAPDKKDNTEDSDFAFITLPVINSEDGLSNVMFAVNLKDKEIVNVRKVFIDSIDDEIVQLKIEDNGEIIADYSLTPELVKDNLNSTEQSYEELLDNDQDAGIQPFGWCETAVYALKAFAGTAQCYLTCGALGLVAGPAGLGCAAICALLLNKPIDSVLNDVCK
ncbi:halocin C8 precursor-like protein [Carnobacterium mobile]|uniref:halocin C8 precursor-like protein n=1 Tax=Carnobacterium mobile TaxID=2750 RepID=UPI0005560CAD|nr:halocin C8 precursor-like protein [Carnobacterium mobile]